MIIKWGISDGCVLQRNEDNVCKVQILGYTNSKSEIKLNALNKAGDIIFSCILNAVFCAQDNNYEFKADLIGIPVGGAYSIIFKNKVEEISFFDVYVGDVYLLGGQSNMQGIGRMNAKLLPMNEVRAFYMNDVWSIAEDPLHNLHEAADPAHEIISGGKIEPMNPDLGVGPGVAFGQRLYEITGVPQGLIACAHGGTSMDQWSPKDKDLSGKSLYGAMLRRFYKNGANVAGLFWYQGCSDTHEGLADKYYEKMKVFVQNVRQDTGIENMPIVAVQIARQCTQESTARFWNTVQHSQYMLEEDIENIAVVPAIDLEMDDFIHISGASQNRLGIRCADAMEHLNSRDYMFPPIRLDKIEVVDYEDSWNCKVILTYKNVQGSLISAGRPSGFDISKSMNKADGNCIIRIDLQGNKVILHTTDNSIDINNWYVHYGLGFQPYCNITDEKDRSLPVIYNVPIGKRRNLSEPCTFAWLAEGAITKIDWDNRDALIKRLNDSFAPKDFYYYFLNVYNISNESDAPIVYYAPFSVNKDADLRLLIGGSGQMKIYIEGEIIEEIDADNKRIHPEQFVVPIKALRGNHMLSIEYSPLERGGKGIFLRFESDAEDTFIEWIR